MKGLKSDCIIVGGGIIGLLTARELACAGQQVIVLERGEVGREASWAGGGVLAPLYPWRILAALHPLMSWSQSYYPTLAEELAAQTGLDPEWTQSGLLIFDIEYKDEAREWACRTNTIIEYMEGDELKAIEPRAIEAHPAALWLPNVAQIRNPRLLRSLKIALELMKVRVLEHTEVRLITFRGDRINGVTTNKGSFEAGSVVVAGGAWSDLLLNEFSYKPDITPVRGQMILYRTPPGFLRCILLKQDCYLIPRRDGYLLVGSTVEHVGFDKSTTEEVKTKLQQGARGILPALADYAVERHWAGLRPGSPGGIPFIGPHPEMKGLYLNAGHFRMGMAIAPGSARLLAELMFGRRPIVPPEPFAWAAARGSEALA